MDEKKLIVGIDPASEDMSVTVTGRITKNKIKMLVLDDIVYGHRGTKMLMDEIHERERRVDRWMNGENVPLVQADYAEIEERILTDLSQDWNIEKMMGFPLIHDERILNPVVPAKKHEPYQKVTDPKKRAKIKAQRAKDKANRKKHR